MAVTRKPTTIRKTAQKRGPTIKQRKTAFDRFNREWAEKILSGSEAHPPYMVDIARNVLERLEGEQCQDGPKQTLPLTSAS